MGDVAQPRPKQGKRKKRFDPDTLNTNLYFLWSLERVGVIYGLETIGKHDWYTWGSDALVDSQNDNGSWAGQHYPGGTEELSTCFALLFLSRANVARDLSMTLKGKFQDPGIATLRGGGDLSKVLPERVAMQPKDKPPAQPPVEAKQPPQRAEVEDFEAEAARLCKTVLQAPAAERSDAIVRLRDSRGSVYTEALARAAKQASGQFQMEIREALGRRLARMTAVTLRDMLKDENLEVRRAAAEGCGRKEEKQFAPDLIALLGDPELLVVEAAHGSLEQITGKNFGPLPNANREEKQKAMASWKEWWATQKK